MATQMAVTFALSGDTARAQALADEKDADADLPVLIEAKKEYAKLK
ncbi:MAG: hypothetical protein IPM66_01650 [Acidobacteriota bacterium]|nr:MAG: hypothetical protein IPM66_01650 [Acidobacteriota bacterium]